MRMAKGDGSPCDRAWEWFEAKKFQTREDLDIYLIENSETLNDYMQQCADNYPWQPPEPEPPEPEPRYASPWGWLFS